MRFCSITEKGLSGWMIKREGRLECWAHAEISRHAFRQLSLKVPESLVLGMKYAMTSASLVQILFVGYSKHVWEFSWRLARQEKSSSWSLCQRGFGCDSPRSTQYHFASSWKIKVEASDCLNLCLSVHCQFSLQLRLRRCQDSWCAFVSNSVPVAGAQRPLQRPCEPVSCTSWTRTDSARTLVSNHSITACEFPWIEKVEDLKNCAGPWESVPMEVLQLLLCLRSSRMTSVLLPCERPTSDYVRLRLRWRDLCSAGNTSTWLKERPFQWQLSAI